MDNQELTLEEYQAFVYGLASEQSKQNWESQLLTAGLGLAGEAGEVAERIKKHLFHGSDWDREKFLLELSDVLWYLTFAAETAGSSIKEIMNMNVDKLRSRYKSGKFTKEEFEAKENSK